MPFALSFWLGALTAAAFAAMFVQLAVAGRRLGTLDRVEPLAAGEMPRVSVVVAARDEARAIEPALRSLLALEGDVEVVAVDDRSSDGTGEILDRIAAAEPRLRVVHVVELPSGWLGKTHALQLGARAATGALLCFTDADVVMRPDTLRRAAAHLLREELDHLTLAPRVVMPGALLQAFGVTFGIYFSLFARPWKARDPRSRAHVGIGAFNLLRADAYRAIGGHAALRLRPDDDIKLAKVVKKHGLAQDFLFGASHLSVEWYRSVPEAVRGLRKNAFAGLDYRLDVLVAASVVHLLLFVGPVPGALLARGAAQACFAAALLLMLALYAGAARAQGTPAWHAVLFPLTSIVFVAALWNAAAYALWTGGIEWRGTRYPLDELRRNRV